MTGAAPLTLAIETSNPSGTAQGGEVAIVRGAPGGADVLGVEGLGTPSAGHDDALVPAIDRLCRRVGVRARQLNRVCVSIGPGGYTSLRIAVTTAKSIAEATGAALFGIPTADGVVRSVDAAILRRGPVAVCLAWKRDDVWVRRFGGAPPDTGATVGLSRLGRLSEEGSHLVVEQRLRSRLVERGILAEGASWSAPVFSALAVHDASAGTPPVDPAALLPLYPREPEAVRAWRERGGAGASP